MRGFHASGSTVGTPPRTTTAGGASPGTWPLVPGEPAELCFDLQPTSVVFRAGHRIRVTVTCADKDTFATPVLDPAPEVSVLRGGTRASRIVLPVVPWPGS